MVSSPEGKVPVDMPVYTIFDLGEVARVTAELRRARSAGPARPLELNRSWELRYGGMKSMSAGLGVSAFMLVFGRRE